MGVLILKSDKEASGLRLPDDKKPKYNKYNVKPKNERTVDGITFDSGKEAYRHSTLKILERAGEIMNIRRQVDYPLKWNGILITIYRADFVYTDVISGKEIVEDVKGLRTREFIMKSRMMKACYGIDVYET